MRITNVSTGPRGINTLAGPILLDKGQVSDEVEVSEAEFNASSKTGWFEFDGDPVKAKDVPAVQQVVAFEAMSDDQLRAHLAKHDIKADGRWARERLLDEARKVKA